MSEYASPSFDDSTTGPEATRWGANGTLPEPTDAAEATETAEGEAAVAVAGEPTNTELPSGMESTAVADASESGSTAVADASESESTAVADAPESSAQAPESAETVVTAEAVETTEPVPTAVHGTTFIGELVRAMRATVDAERARAAEETDRRRDEHIATIHARREAEAARMRELAEEDLRAVDAWAETERERIRAERERRAAAVRDDLEVSLAEHRGQIDRDIERIEVAVTAYRGEVDAFFGELDRETDPVAIARHASRRPAFPALETIAEQGAAAAEAVQAEAAVAEAAPVESAAPVEAAVSFETASTEAEDTTETPGVGVMDPQVVAEPVEPWAPWSVPAPAGDSDAVAETLDSVAVPTAAEGHQSGSVLQSLPISRPMAWLRRDRDSGDQRGS